MQEEIKLNSFQFVREVEYPEDNPKEWGQINDQYIINALILCPSKDNCLLLCAENWYHKHTAYRQY